LKPAWRRELVTVDPGDIPGEHRTLVSAGPVHARRLDRKSAARDPRALALRIRNIAHARPRFGYQPITVMLRREGWPVTVSAYAGFIDCSACRCAYA